VRENDAVTATPNSKAHKALALFAPIAGNYERWAAVLSLGQDPRWRTAMVGGLKLPTQARVLDVAAGTGAITRLLEVRGVLRPGGEIGMVEFGRPRGIWSPWWSLYTRRALPFAGATIGSGWREVGSFLGPSIDAFHRPFPNDRLAEVWRSAGLVDVRVARRSLGGGLIMWARKA
jgi:ubiquinone/menaquinone biosynthesis C-methylase UbiE